MREAFLYAADYNIFSFLYATDYKILIPNGFITLFHEKGELRFKIESGEKEYKLTFKKYGSESCCSNAANGGDLFSIRTSKTLEMTHENYYELLGRSVSIYSLAAEMTLFNSHVMLKNNDSGSAMIIPENGVTSYSESTENYYRLDAYIFGDKKIKVELLTN